MNFAHPNRPNNSPGSLQGGISHSSEVWGAHGTSHWCEVRAACDVETSGAFCATGKLPIITYFVQLENLPHILGKHWKTTSCSAIMTLTAETVATNHPDPWQPAAFVHSINALVEALMAGNWSSKHWPNTQHHLGFQFGCGCRFHL